MSSCEPSYLEIFLTGLAMRLPGNRVYRGFAASLPVTGEETVLDFGCGMGTVARYTAKRLPRGRLVCADLSERWLAACRRTLRGYPNVSFLPGDICSRRPADGSFDVIYCHYVLHDIPDSELERALPALAGLLKDRGRLLFREPLKDTGKLRAIQRLAEGSGLRKLSSRITDIPLMGNAIENAYSK